MLAIFLSFLLLFFMHLKTQAMEVSGVSIGGAFNVPVVSFTERRFSTIYKQKYDFSCGSAALASLLTYHYDDNINEQNVFIDMFKYGDKTKIQQQGFSLLDMKKFLERRGYKSNGFRMKLDQLTVPAITIINHDGYMHFVIIKGFNTQEVLIGDPSVGVKIIPRNEFEEMWGNRILFLINDNENIAAHHFKNNDEWSLTAKSPLETVVNRSSLAIFNLLQPGNFDF
ncbi:C39 family peptidase [Neptunomonas antarctica]|nr:C39 family peptidase [Neptunomonas antarctica]